MAQIDEKKLQELQALAEKGRKAKEREKRYQMYVKITMRKARAASITATEKEIDEELKRKA